MVSLELKSVHGRGSRADYRTGRPYGAVCVLWGSLSIASRGIVSNWLPDPYGAHHSDRLFGSTLFAE